MPKEKCFREQHHDEERGASLVLVAVAMVALLGMAALAIDLASLYVARNEAQRAADAAALAGAKQFVDSGFAAGLVSQGVAQTMATQAAEQVGGQNFVGGTPAVIMDSDVSFDFSTANDPRITVLVARDAAHGNPMPTFFSKIFGVQSANVSAKATAEAFVPSPGNGPPVGISCVKPWFIPNCDPSRTTAPLNPNCGVSEFVDATACPNSNPALNGICYPGAAPGGVIGELLTLKPGDPSVAATSSKYYPVFLPTSPNLAPICPACSSGSSSGGGDPSGALYMQNIECCNQNTIPCGNNTVTAITGNKVGPTQAGVDCLINELPSGQGQDILNVTSTPPFTITGGSNNPVAANRGSLVSSSPSVVNVPIYDGSALCPGMGGSCGATVQVIGFLQVFIKGETNPQGTVEAYILSVSACGNGSSGGGNNPGPVVGGAGQAVPIRLIRNPGS